MYDLLVWMKEFVLSLSLYPLFYWILGAALASSAAALIIRILRGR